MGSIRHLVPTWFAHGLPTYRCATPPYRYGTLIRSQNSTRLSLNFGQPKTIADGTSHKKKKCNSGSMKICRVMLKQTQAVMHARQPAKTQENKNCLILFIKMLILWISCGPFLFFIFHLSDLSPRKQLYVYISWGLKIYILCFLDNSQ